MGIHPTEKFSRLTQVQVNAYLERLQVEKGILTIDFLKELHNAHLFQIPYENLDFYFQRKLRFDLDEFFDRIIPGTGGGIAIELNNLFCQLLLSLGFDCWLVSGRKKIGDDWVSFNEHPLIIVKLNNQLWLADVGSIGLFVDPKKLSSDTIQIDYNQYFRFECDPDENFILQQSKDATIFDDIYCFNHFSVKAIQFLERFEYHQLSKDSYLKRQKLVYKSHKDGSTCLTDRMLTKIVRGEKEETEILHEDDFAAKLQEYFGISYDELFHQRFQQ